MARLSSLSAKLNQAGSSPTAPTGPSVQSSNFLRLLANSPAATAAYKGFANPLANGQLTGRQRESLALLIAEINGSSYCLSAHYALAKKAGVTEDEMRAARKATASDAQTRALLRFTQEVVLQRGEISDGDFQALRHAGFNDALIAEVLANIALNLFTNYFNSVVRTDVDFPLLKPGADAPQQDLPQKGTKTHKE